MPDTRRIKVLYVDDEPINTTLFKITFKNDFEIILAHSAEDALEKLEAGNDPDVLISDFRMPGLNGVEFIREAHKRFGERPSIILSGYDRNEEIAHAFEDETIVAYLKKPMDKPWIKNTVLRSINGVHP